jgi:small-conductance mechanosensitive channel
VKIDVHVHFDGTEQQQRSEAKLNELLALVKNLIREDHSMSQKMDELVAQVAKTDGVIDSAVVALTGFGQQLTDLQTELAAAGVDTTAVETLRADLAAKTDALAAAIATVTPPVTPIAP